MALHLAPQRPLHRTEVVSLLSSHPFRPLALVLAIVACAVGLTACGSAADSAGGGGATDAQAVLKRAFAGGTAIRSGRLDVSVALDLKGVPSLTGPVELELQGPFESQGTGKLPKFAFDLGLGAGGRQLTFGLVSTGTKGFLTVEGQAFDIGDDAYASLRKGYEQAAGSAAKQQAGTPGLSALGVDPQRWLRDPELLGDEEVGGTTTRHVRAKVDVARFLQDLNRLLERGGALRGTGVVPKPLTAQQRKDIADSITSADVDVYGGKDDGALRKLTLDVRLDVPADVRPTVGGLQGGRVRFTLTFADLNKPQSIAAPSDAKPLSELKGALQQLGLIGASTASSPSSSSSSAGGSTATAPSGGTATTPSDKYVQCLGTAGTDVAKIQQCADLLGP